MHLLSFIVFSTIFSLNPSFVDIVANETQLPILRKEVGNLSMYKPNDGFNRGILACGPKFTEDQIHIAHRRWKSLGCNRLVLVCASDTQRCAWARVMDAGPWGIVPKKGYSKKRLDKSKPYPEWRVWLKLRPPEAYKFRAAADLSYGLWKSLDKPKALSQIALYFFPTSFDPFLPQS